MKRKFPDIEKLRKIEKVAESFDVSDFMRRKKGNVLEVVVKTILSQNTSDNLRDRAFENLLKRFGRIDRKLLDVDEKEIEKEIEICGLARTKAKRIKYVLSKIFERYEKPEELCKDENAFEFLTSLKGIGPKSSAVILAFACGKDTFPVDTHVSRILRRVGVVPENWSREKIYFEVSPHVRSKIKTHIFLINHGRKVCKAQKPLCPVCKMKSFCDFYRTQAI